MYKTMMPFFAILISLVILLAGCGSDDTDKIVMFGGDTYTRIETADGITVEDGYFFDSLSNEVHYVFYADGIDSSDLLGTWECDGNKITVTLEDGSTEAVSIVESKENSSNILRATKISIFGETYTSTSS
jgi:hypothetical protein